MDFNDVLQWVGVGMAVVLAVAWIVLRIVRKRRNPDCDSGCDGCPLKEKCK